MLVNESVEQRRYLGSFIACGVGLAVVIAWVLLAKPAEGWFGLPVGLVGVPCAFGVLMFGIALVTGFHRPVKRSGGVLIDSRVTAIFVEFSDGRVTRPLSLGDTEQVSRIEALLRRRAEQRAA